jgi:hypothetical protein
MKSIGNGWKRAQEAKIRAAKSDFTAWVHQQNIDAATRQSQYMQAQSAQHSLYGDGLRAMSPESMQAKAEREAPLMQNANPLRDILAGPHVVVPMDIANCIKSRQKPPPTLWQRIKRALR